MWGRRRLWTAEIRTGLGHKNRPGQVKSVTVATEPHPPPGPGFPPEEIPFFLFLQLLTSSFLPGVFSTPLLFLLSPPTSSNASLLLLLFPKTSSLLFFPSPPCYVAVFVPPSSPVFPLLLPFPPGRWGAEGQGQLWRLWEKLLWQRWANMSWSWKLGKDSKTTDKMRSKLRSASFMMHIDRNNVWKSFTGNIQKLNMKSLKWPQDYLTEQLKNV